MKNHFVSQFIIRRFSDAMNVFDLHTGKIDLNKKPDKIFYKDDIYTEEIENLTSYNIESRIANLLDRKILNKDEIVLTREELYLLKRYMLLCSVRNLTPEYFCKILRKYTSNMEKYMSINEHMPIPYKIDRSIKDLNLSDKDIYLNALKVFATAATPYDVCNNPLATVEMLGWSLPFLEGYIAFWDAPEGYEFVLSDCTMASEYDGFYQMTGGIEISKTSYLLDEIEKKEPVFTFLGTQSVMYENYDIFNLSSTRSLILINPFFRLYHRHEMHFYDGKGNNEIKIFNKPDIWPAIIQNKELFNVPRNEYLIKGMYMPDDKFIYSPKTLSYEDYIYINSLLLKGAKEIIGFNNARNIIDTIYYHIWEHANYGSIKEDNNDFFTVMGRLFDGIKNSPYNHLGEFCSSIGANPKVEVIKIFEQVMNNLYKDFNENRYICEYYLKHQEGLEDFKQLDFLGEGKKKIEFFKQHLDEINKRGIKH